jgi:hypothetical protein
LSQPKRRQQQRYAGKERISAGDVEDNRIHGCAFLPENSPTNAIARLE